MNKIKNILALVVLSITVLYSCGDNNGIQVNNFDHEAQALIDNDSLTQFLKNYYFDTSVDSIKPITAGKTSLADDLANNISGNFKEIKVKENDIDYSMYVYVIEEGGKDANNNVINDKGFPTVMDSILSTYQLWAISRTDTISLVETGTNPFWLSLGPTPNSLDFANSSIRGWAYGLKGNLNGGKNITSNGPITYENFGRCILIIPSGLAYRNGGTTTIGANQNLLFYINLYDLVKDTDHDNDGVASINEDANGDGDPRNDFSDDNNPATPDYLNPNIK